MVRLERFELPTFWFEAGTAREIVDLQRYVRVLSVPHFEPLPDCFALWLKRRSRLLPKAKRGCPGSGAFDRGRGFSV